jgi:hypothetical protein
LEKKHAWPDKIYGISQNSVTKDYVIVFYNEYNEEYFKECYSKMYKYDTNWISGNEKINDLIRVMQLKFNAYKDILFEWIPYDQFSDIEKIGKGGFSTVYLATWRDGPLRYNKNEWIRDSDKKVALKCLDDSKNIDNEFLNEV